MRLITQMKADLRADGGIKSLVNDLLGLSTEVEDDMVEPGEEEPSIDVRLRYFDGAWSLHTGDVQYDTDHRGFWGSSSVGQEMTEDQARDVACDLVDQVFEHAAFRGEE